MIGAILREMRSGPWFSGWKSYAAGAGLLAYGAVSLYFGIQGGDQQDIDKGFKFLCEGLGFIGLRDAVRVLKSLSGRQEPAEEA